MDILRTPDDRFKDLPGYDFTPNYLMQGEVRIHYLDKGPKDGQPMLLLHGEPSWSYLYRKMIPLFTAAGFRVIAPDLVGFGRSDKPANKNDYSYQSHMDWMTGFVEALDLQNIILVCQDWGGLIGLRMAAEQEARFARIVAANTFLPTGDRKMPMAFTLWQTYSQKVPRFKVGKIITKGCTSKLSKEIIAAYDAPFPDESYKAGARMFPMLVPNRPDDPASDANRAAWQVLKRWQKPFLTAFSDKDPITRGADKYLRKVIPGCEGQPHTTISGGGHFLQEDKGEELATVIVDWVKG